MGLQSDVVLYATENPNTTELLDNGKLRFSLSGMEFAPNTKRELLEVYARGRAYRRALWTRENEDYDFAQHEPYIVPHTVRDENHFLFCRLTNSTLPRRKECVEKHIAGRRFRRRFKEAENARAEREGLRARRREKAQVKRGAGSANETDHGRDNGSKEIDTGANGQGNNREEGDLSNRNLSDSDIDMDAESSDGDDELNSVKGDEKMVMQLEAVTGMDQQEDDGSVFWTRGRERFAVVDRHENDDDIEYDDEWERVPQKVGRRRNGGPKRVLQGMKQIRVSSELNEPSGHRVSPTAKETKFKGMRGKRTRSGKPVKKVRRPRQRRNLGTAST